MKVAEVSADILVFTGPELQSVSTAFVDGEDVLLVDTMASEADAQALLKTLHHDMGMKVRQVIVTHYMDDHLAGLHLLTDAVIWAQEQYSHTYFSQMSRSEKVARTFVHPNVTIQNGSVIQWGVHELHLFHNPGHTVSTLCIDVPTADLMLVGDSVVGHLSYLSRTSPAMLDASLVRIERRGRGTIVPGHIGPLPGSAASDARYYLRQLRERILAIRAEFGALDPASVRAISAIQCLSPGYVPSQFESEWHESNLNVILERDLFPASTSCYLPPLMSGAAN